MMSSRSIDAKKLLFNCSQVASKSLWNVHFIFRQQTRQPMRIGFHHAQVFVEHVAYSLFCRRMRFTCLFRLNPMVLGHLLVKFKYFSPVVSFFLFHALITKQHGVTTPSHICMKFTCGIYCGRAPAHSAQRLFNLYWEIPSKNKELVRVQSWIFLMLKNMVWGASSNHCHKKTNRP